ncbi:hypothetical protein AB0D33_13775 [Streptomyces sp. NPDC048404]|uniref:hypothetical protein n=1 Tax=unclassified Streptomyces TaxID=2593676 RepID=UPI00344A2373
MNEQWRQRQRAGGPAGTSRQPAHSGGAPQPAVLVHELVTVAKTDEDEARACARRLAACLPPEARSVLLDALTEEGSWHDGDDAGGYGSGGALSFDGPQYTVPRARSALSLLPAYRAPGPDRPAAAPGSGDPGSPGDGDDGGEREPHDGEFSDGDGEREPRDSEFSDRDGKRAPGDGEFYDGDDGERESGDGGFWPAPRDEPPAAVIRLRFADASALERAGACFDGAWSEPGTHTLQVPADAGVQTLRSVLAVLDAAALTPESLTVHTNELDDVFAAFTHLL